MRFDLGLLLRRGESLFGERPALLAPARPLWAGAYPISNRTPTVSNQNETAYQRSATHYWCMKKRAAEPRKGRRSNLARVRAKGLRSAVRATRVTAAVSVVLSLVYSAVAALGFSGQKSSKHAAVPTPVSTTGVRLALPPKGQGGQLAAPVSLPVQSAPTPPAVTSGGS